MKELRGVGKKTVVHCPTEELAECVLAIAHAAGYKWCSGDSFVGTNNKWSSYKQNTCYAIMIGEFAYTSFYKDECYEVIDATRFIRLNSNSLTINKPKFLTIKKL